MFGAKLFQTILCCCCFYFGWNKCALELFDRIRQLNYDVRKHIGRAVLYEDDPNFNTLSFYQLNYVQHDKVSKSETNYS